jgi:hypothetical protein
VVKRGGLMVSCGDLNGDFPAQKKMSLFENISVDLPMRVFVKAGSHTNVQTTTDS